MRYKDKIEKITCEYNDFGEQIEGESVFIPCNISAKGFQVLDNFGNTDKKRTLTIFVTPKIDIESNFKFRLDGIEYQVYESKMVFSLFGLKDHQEILLKEI